MGTELTTLRNSMALRRRKEIIGDVVGAFESETAAVFLATAPAREHITLYTLVGVIFLTTLLCTVVNLDIVVTGTGIVSPVSGLLYISPFDTGIIKKVNVRPGDVVKKGASLATLDPTFTQADLEQLQEHLNSDEAVVTREEAEVGDRPFIVAKTDHVWALQNGIWLKRQGEYRSDVHNFDSQINSSEAIIAQYESDVRKYTERLKIAGDVENLYQPLLDKGYVSKLQLMSATDSRTEMSRLFADAQQQVASNRQTANALRAQRDAYIQKWHSDTGAQLILDKNDFDQTRDSLTKAEKLRNLVSLDAPEDAIVLKIGKVSPGSVYGGQGQDALNPVGEPLFTLMPVNAPLFADIMVQTQDIGFVKLGQRVQIKFDAYRFTEYGMAAGVVKTISDNSFTVDQNNQPTLPYFKVHVAITDLKLRHLPKNFRLMPGNTLSGDVMVGERTIISYLVEGILRQTSNAMREP
jgi:hemolysin D